MATTSPSISFKSDYFLGVAFALLAAIGFSGKAILVKLAYQDSVDAVTLLALRMTFAVPFFVGVALWAIRQGAPLTRRDTNCWCWVWG
jgi:drug/metabolite transporter (DMT)-like permease